MEARTQTPGRRQFDRHVRLGRLSETHQKGNRRQGEEGKKENLSPRIGVLLERTRRVGRVDLSIPQHQIRLYILGGADIVKPTMTAKVSTLSLPPHSRPEGRVLPFKLAKNNRCSRTAYRGPIAMQARVISTKGNKFVMLGIASLWKRTIYATLFLT